MTFFDFKNKTIALIQVLKCNTVKSYLRIAMNNVIKYISIFFYCEYLGKSCLLKLRAIHSTVYPIVYIHTYE